MYIYNMMYTYGDVFLQKNKKMIAVHFGEVVQPVHFVYDNSTIKILEHLLAMPIWYNTQIIEGKIQSWVDKGGRHRT